MKEGVNVCVEPKTEDEIKKLYSSEIPIFKAWGQYVRNAILTELEKTEKLEEFLKIPVTVRIKEEDSLIAKALHRQKDYSKPYHDIEDKVGIRFVVLLTEDTENICNIIKQIPFWNYSEDQDFKKNREEYPESFPYESCHFVVKPLDSFSYDFKQDDTNKIEKVTIPKGTPCEIQVRSLLQHAYAELSHETLYKKKVRQKENIKRFLARSMALIESADYFFIQVKTDIKKESKFYKQLLDLSSKFYPSELLSSSNEEANMTILDLLLQKDAIIETDIICLEKYLNDNADRLNSKVRGNYHTSFIYRIPTVLLFYFLADKRSAFLRDTLILPNDITTQLYADLGVSYVQD